MEQIRIEDVPERLVAVVRRQVPLHEMGSFFADALGAVTAAVGRAGGSCEGIPFGWYHGRPGEMVDAAGGFPVTGVPDGGLEGDVQVVRRPGGLAAVATHIGPYDTLAATYRALEVWLDDRQLDPSDHNWEEYLSDPEAQPDPDTWETRIVWPLA